MTAHDPFDQPPRMRPRRGPTDAEIAGAVLRVIFWLAVAGLFAGLVVAALLADPTTP